MKYEIKLGQNKLSVTKNYYIFILILFFTYNTFFWRFFSPNIFVTDYSLEREIRGEVGELFQKEDRGETEIFQERQNATIYIILYL